MARIQILKILVNERLTAAAEEIFGAFERTIIQYEEEIDRQRKLLDFGPKRRTDPLQLRVCEEMVLPEQQRSPSVGLEDPEPSQIKDEQEELWTSREGEHLQEQEEEDVMRFTFTPVPVKGENDDENSQPSQLSLNQMKEDRVEDPLPSTSTQHFKSEAEGEDGGISEQGSNSDLAIDVELTSDSLLMSSDCSESEKPFSCTICGKILSHKGNLKVHMRIHSREKPFVCTICSRSFGVNKHLQVHMTTHAGERPFSCPVCGKGYGRKQHLQIHIRTHTGEKPFRCTVCAKTFGRSGQLRVHMRTHTGERPYSCPICGKTSGHKGNLQKHIRVHTGEKPFRCTVCSKTFGQKEHLTVHMRGHTGERPYIAAVSVGEHSLQCRTY